MADAIELTSAQQFELERMRRAIDSTTDVHALQGLCKQLLQAWLTQRAATSWAIRQSLPQPPLGTTGG